MVVHQEFLVLKVVICVRIPDAPPLTIIRDMAIAKININLIISCKYNIIKYHYLLRN